MGNAVMNVVIGNKGSGKSALGVAVVQLIEQFNPSIPKVANYHIKDAYGKDIPYYPQIMRWLAIKLIVETKLIQQGILQDYTYAEAICDEVSISEELEARGSSAVSSVPKTQLIALSRKVNVTIWLISQLMSQFDKRGQWLGDYYILCKSHYKPASEEIDYFSYEVNDQDLNPLCEFDIGGDVAKHFIFPRYQTNEVPNFELLVETFAADFDLKQEDLDDYAKQFNVQRMNLVDDNDTELTPITLKGSKKKGTRIFYRDKHFVVAAEPEFNPDTGLWTMQLESLED